MGLTPEDKKSIKEAKKLAILVAEAEMRKKIKRDELQREIAAQAKNKDTLDHAYKALMMKIKEPVFKQDVEIMWRTFERAYDKKDYLISYIMKLRDVADDQYQCTVSSLSETIDTMINKFLLDLEKVSKKNDQATSKLLKEGDLEVNDIIKHQNTEEKYLQLLKYAAGQEANSLAWATRGENAVVNDEQRTKDADIRYILKSYLEHCYSNVWDSYKAVLKNYIQQTADNNKKANILRRKANAMNDLIASQAKELANSKGMLKRLRYELSTYESGTKQAGFRNRRDSRRAACQKMKQRMMNGINLDTAQLALLVKSSDSTLEWLREAHKKAEKISRMAALCRNFETEREKELRIRDNGTAPPHSPLQKQQKSDLVTNAKSSTCGFTRLWQRMAKVELTKRALLRERDLLLHENELLEIKLKGLTQKSIEPKTEACLCNKNDVRKEILRPTAVEGTLEVAKLAKTIRGIGK